MLKNSIVVECGTRVLSTRDLMVPRVKTVQEKEKEAAKKTRVKPQRLGLGRLVTVLHPR